MSVEPLVSCKNISKKFCVNLRKSLRYGAADIIRDLNFRNNGLPSPALREGEFWSVDDVSFDVKRGECLGVIGRNGAGKTTLLKMINGLIRPDIGSIAIRGRVGGLIALGAGFNPVLTGRENLYVNASVLGLHRHEIDKKYDEIVEFAEMEQFMEMPVRNYSSGMTVRLGFSIAVNAAADVILLDEVFAVGDIKFRAKSYEKIDQIKKNSAVIVVTHNLQQLGQIASSAILLEKGSKLFEGNVVDAREKFARVITAERKNETQTVWFPPIKFLAAKIDKASINYADDIVVSVTLETERELSGYSHIHIFDEQTGHVGAESSPLMNSGANFFLKKGLNKFLIKLGSVRLRGGSYSVGFQFRDHEKRMLAASKYELSFKVENLVPVSASYQIESQISYVE